MKKYIIAATTMATLLLSACSFTGKDKYDVAGYYDQPQQDSLLVNIVTYIFEAPPYTLMKDRFQDKHRPFYSKASAQFSIDKYYIAKDGTHYFYVIRPGGNPSEKRGTGGYFRTDKQFKLKDFHEVFVTPFLPEAEVKGRCAFLFDEMINHNIGKFLTMKTYVQWPNKISYYDTTTYEWKLTPGYMN